MFILACLVIVAFVILQPKSVPHKDAMIEIAWKSGAFWAALGIFGVLTSDYPARLLNWNPLFGAWALTMAVAWFWQRTKDFDEYVKRSHNTVNDEH